MAGENFEKKLSELLFARCAQDVRNLPVDEQYRRLAEVGLTLRVTNFENWITEPEAKIIIPVEIE